ncbi:MAG: hypothetical protein OXK80_01310 [Bdellovibrionales bacterium]|nr:hypothetical protein [Bdellovibrionales bacterium]
MKTLLLFLLISSYAYGDSGGLAPGDEDKCSKALTNSNQKRTGIFGRMRGLFSRKPQAPQMTVLDELKTPDLKIGVHIRGNQHYGDNMVLGSESVYFDLNDNWDTIYRYFYQPARNEQRTGYFSLVFKTHVQVQNPPSGFEVDDRRSLFTHVIYWESDVKKVQLDESTIKQIFKRLYRGEPSRVAQAIYNKLAFTVSLDESTALLEPLLFKDNKDELRRVIIDVIQNSEKDSGE